MQRQPVTAYTKTWSGVNLWSGVVFLECFSWSGDLGRGLRGAGCWPFSVSFSGFDYGTSLVSSFIVSTDCHSW